jgi:hypothetical protein
MEGVSGSGVTKRAHERLYQMSRPYRFLGWTYVVCCLAIILLLGHRPQPAAALAVAPARAVRAVPARQAQPTPRGNDAAEWFRQAKPYCNAVEVAVLQRSAPPPANAQGVGYHAACFALAGKIDDARHLIDALDASGRQTAAYIVFNVGHPVADAGDDRSAGPIMELVVDYLPNDYMALYHAGMAEYMLGQRDLARKNLEAFVSIYQQNDGWRSNGLDVLRRLSDSTNTDVDRRRPHEPGA